VFNLIRHNDAVHLKNKDLLYDEYEYNKLEMKLDPS